VAVAGQQHLERRETQTHLVRVALEPHLLYLGHQLLTLVVGAVTVLVMVRLPVGPVVAVLAQEQALRLTQPPEQLTQEAVVVAVET
jgi:hypothetical protein